MKDLNFNRIIAHANYLILFVDDENKQKLIINKLKEYKDSLPDGKWIDKIENKILSNKKDYFDIAEFLIKDIERTKRTPENLITIQKLLSEINEIINAISGNSNTERTPAKKISDLSSWS